MKNITIFTFVLLFKITFFGQIINIPDLNFKNKLLAASPDNIIASNDNTSIKIDVNNDGQIQVSEALLVKRLFIPQSNISSLIGIQSFLNIKILGVHYNNLTSLDVSNLTQLVNLSCGVNQLTAVNVNSSLIERIDIGGNYFTSFNFSIFPNLKFIGCQYNNFTTLDFSGNPLLEDLLCSNNFFLTSLNVKNGRLQNIGSASPWQDCWKTGCPNLSYICVDADEVAPLQTFLATCATSQPVINSNCALGNDSFIANEFEVSPNPSENIFNINFNGFLETTTQIEVFNLLSQKLLQEAVKNTENHSLSLAHLPTGTYILRISDGSSVITKKIIKN